MRVGKVRRLMKEINMQNMRRRRWSRKSWRERSGRARDGSRRSGGTWSGREWTLDRSSRSGSARGGQRRGGGQARKRINESHFRIRKLEKAVGAAGEYKNTNFQISKFCVCATNNWFRSTYLHSLANVFSHCNLSKSQSFHWANLFLWAYSTRTGTYSKREFLK